MATPIESIRRELLQVEPDAKDVRRIGEGYEAEIFAYRLGDDNRVLRLFQNSSYDRRAEWENLVLRRLAEIDFPVPATYGFRESIRSPWNRPFLLIEFVDGKSLGPAFWGPPSPARESARSTLFNLMARLHAVPVDRFISEETALLPAQFEVIERYLGVEVSDALERAMPAAEQLVLLHGDFHANNVLCGERGCKVIDWSDAWCGDPRYDVAWVRLLVRADEEPDRGQADLERYGQPLGELGYFEAFGAAKVLAERLAAKNEHANPDDRGFEGYLWRVLTERLGIDFPRPLD